MIKQRPDPNVLLQQVQEEELQEHRGKLKIYLGAAPGVGKTHSMLCEALEQQAKGLDVVIGVIESHGRVEIENMLKKLAILPKLPVEYHGKQLFEFDLDISLKRNPGLILMDEMAHTNISGMRHKKRWQDIKELLDRGIDVYTTLNVQHIESLSDDVSRIIKAPVKETVPDVMIEMANTIELIDIPTEDLLKRLSEGKVYIPAQAELATEFFFRKGNLIALRELALRTLAKRVNVQALLYRQGKGIKQIWPVMEKILVCVGPGQESHKLIRAAKRMATNLQAEWIAVYVDTTRSKLSEEQRNQAIQNLYFAEQLGAETRVLTGYDIVKEIINLSRDQNITLIMIWKHIRPRWRNFLFRSLADEILRSSDEIDVYTMSGGVPALLKKSRFMKSTTPLFQYFLSACIVAIATLINFLFFPLESDSNLIMVFLLGMTVIALFGRTGPSITGIILSALAYCFFFTPPYHNFLIDSPEYFFSLLGMLIVATVISHLTRILRRQTEAARLTEYQTSALYTLSRKLSRTRGSINLLKTGINYISEIFHSEVLALLPQKDHLTIKAKSQTNQELDAKELGIAQWVFELGQKAGLGTGTLSFSEALFIPLLGSCGVIGVLRVQPFKKINWATPEKIQLLESCANQIALALEVDNLQEQKKKSELQSEANRIRSTLLQSVTHDLSSPLESIINAASSQIELAKNLNEHHIEKLGENIYVEAEQLNRLINNLLQINVLESGKIILKKEPLSLKEIINQVINASHKKLQERPVHINISKELPLILFDSLLIQEVLLNLIDNAIKFTPSMSAIEINAMPKESKALVSITDRGPGVISDEANKLFDKFYRGHKLTSERGLGLGLALCRIIVEAHGGKIWVENYKDGGATFHFTLPI